MTPRILIVEPERELRLWFRHHIEVLWPEAMPEEMEPERFESTRASVSTATMDLILFGLHAGEDATQRLQQPLRRLLRQPACPPVVVIASGGNELCAVDAMRAGVQDYLPRALLTSALLGTAVRGALRRARRAARMRQRRRAHGPAGSARAAPAFTPPGYSLLHQLGDSSRATVYLAHSAALGRPVALKVSKPAAGNGEARRQFAREHAAISTVRDPSVVNIYDYGVHAEREFIAMEYFPCGDLKMRLRLPLSVSESFEYAQRICAALQVIHRGGLLHRDLKPPNIMLRQDGSIVLIDFGIAKQMDSATHTTAAGVLRGSPYYMSPEQAQGLQLDQRSDLYSLGVIFYEMLSGSRPYLGSTAVAIMQLHVQGPRPPLPRALAHFEPLVERLMARDRDRRVPDAMTALQLLQLYAPESSGSGTALPDRLAS
jgi:eukaryotic-like serine/threonine-protein kinase